MKQSDRLKTFGIGFVIGCVIVSFIITGRNEKKKSMKQDLLVPQHETMDGIPSDPIPENAPNAIREGRIQEFKKFEDENGQKRVWLLNFKNNYSLVQLEEEQKDETLKYSYLAADQILVTVKPGTYKSAVQEFLKESPWHFRDYHKQPDLYVIGINQPTIDSVYRAIEEISKFDLITEAKPDYIIFKK
jgi:hypothetical protein